MSDKAFTISFGISLGLHLVLIITQLLSLDLLHIPKRRTELQVVYEEAVPDQALQVLQERLAKAKRDLVASPAAPSVLGEQTQIRIPDRPLLTESRNLADIMPDASSIVDLTNLVEASRGDPVLLSYFSAIREQIQRTANTQAAWLTGDQGQGLVYVSFVLSSSGGVGNISIVSDRSVRAQPLWDAALGIVKTAAPFPPFPPSMAEPSKTVVVPLEFLVGS